MKPSRGDDALLGMLGSAVRRYDPVPDAVRHAARAASSMVSLDAELATLVYDSSFGDEDTRALVRGGGGNRELTFESPQLTVELQVHTVERRLLGQLVPPGPAMIEVRSPTDTLMVKADHLGRFAAEGVPMGPVSLRCRAESGPPTDTEWVTL